MNTLKSLTAVLVLCFAFGLSTNSLNAQTKFGASIAYNLASFGMQNESQALSRQAYSDQVQYQGTENGLSFGLAMYTSFDKLFLKTDVRYLNQKSTYTISTYVGSEGDINKVSTELTDNNHYISFPVVAGMQFNKIQIGFGPVFNFIIDRDTQVADGSNLSYQDRAVNTAFQLYTAYKITSNVHLTLSYEKSFSKVGNGFIYNDRTVDLDAVPAFVNTGLSVYF